MTAQGTSSAVLTAVISAVDNLGHELSSVDSSVAVSKQRGAGKRAAAVGESQLLHNGLLLLLS